MSFEKKVQRLEEIVRALESRDLSLEKGLKLFEEGIACLRGALLELGSELRGEPVPPSLAALGARPGRPPEAVQILSPRQASLMPSEVVPVHQAVGRIAAELIAPCPPGTPVVIAGQRVPREILEFASLQTVRVVIE